MLKDENGNAIEIGHRLPGPKAAVVDLITEYETGGVVLAYSDHAREYWVWTVNGQTGELTGGEYRWDRGDALHIFFERSMWRAFASWNMSAPTYTYLDKNKQAGR